MTERGCDNCSLKNTWPTISTPQMPISGATQDGDVLVLGEAPGEQEDRDGIQFVGKSGNLLRRCIPGRDMDRVVFQNTVRCRGPGNTTPSIRDVHSCGTYLDADIEALPIKAILGVGGVPLSKFWPKQNITRVHGVRFPIQVGEKVIWYYPILHPSYALRTGDERSPAFYVLRSDVRRFFKEIDRWGKPTIWQPKPAEVQTPHIYQEAKAILARMEGPLGLDLETQKLKPYLKDSVLLAAAVSDGTTTMAWPIDHPEATTPWGLKLLLEIASTRQWVAHNANFELIWMLHKAGADWVPAQFEDSQACGRLYHERESILSLDMMTRVHLGFDVKSLHQLNINNMISEPLEKVLPYNGLDAQASALLFKMLRPTLNTENYDRFIGTIEATARMELMGLPADLDLSRSMRAEWQAKNDAANAKAQTIYEVKEFERTKQIEFNIASPEHVGEALVTFGKVPLPKTSRKGDDGVAVDGVRWSTDDKHLLEFGPGNPLVKAVIEYREAAKQISTYLDSTIRHCEEAIDGMLHPGYTTMFTSTTRLSARDPNIQNYPSRRHKELRKQVPAPAGHVLLAADMGQIDARIYACITKDRNLCQSFIDDEDIHAYWRDQCLDIYPHYLERLAKETNETDEKKILKGARNIIKSDFVFASFYGSLAKQIHERTNIPMEMVQELLNRFWKKYPDAHRWLKNQRQLYADTGHVTMICGMIRRGILWGNEPINTPMQAGTAQVVNDALISLSKLSVERHDPFLHPRIQVHDDITMIVPDTDDQIEYYMKVVAEEMVKVRHLWQIVPFTVEFKIGYNWCDMEEISVVRGDYHR